MTSAWRHALALCTLLVVLCLRWPEFTLQLEWLDDEAIYIRAFQATAANVHPYEGGHYLYLPVLAVFGGKLIGLIGPDMIVALMRTANLLGVVFLAWSALQFWPMAFHRQLLLAAVLVQAPGFEFGLRYGNLSLLVGAAVVAGILLAPLRPVFSGILLGLATVTKPVAPGALIVFATARPARREDRHVYLVASLIAGAMLVVSILSMPYLEDFLGLRAGKPLFRENVAWHRLFWSLGLRVDALVWAMLAFVGIGILGLCCRNLTRLQLLAVTSAATLVAIPLVWSHTLLITLPLQMVALRLVYRERNLGAPGEATRRFARYRVWITAAACTSLHFCGAIHAMPEHPRLSLVAAAVPALTPLYLAILVFWFTRQGRDPGDWPFGLGENDTEAQVSQLPPTQTSAMASSEAPKISASSKVSLGA